MKKLLVTYRATIDRHVPIMVKSRFGKGALKNRGRFFVIRERIRFSS